MIRESSSMDRAVATGRFGRPRVIAGIVVMLLLATVGLAFPAVRNWTRADRAVDASLLRTAIVKRGDLHRDVWIQGRVVAALHPTLFSPAQGVVTLRVKPGTQVHRGDVLAVVDSSELRSRLAQAESQLASARSDLERQRIVSRQRSVRAEQQLALLRVRADAASRALARADRAFSAGIGNRAELEAAQDAERIAKIELEQSAKDVALDAETVSFELRNREEVVRREEAIAVELRQKTSELTIAAPSAASRPGRKSSRPTRAAFRARPRCCCAEFDRTDRKGMHHSARVAGERPEHAHRLHEIHGAIDERLLHLRTFLEAYARFARLPAPRREPAEWRPLLEEIGQLYPFRLEGEPPAASAIDRAQIEHVLINLLKNAHESGSAPNEVVVTIARTVEGVLVRVLDRGRGMSDDVLRQALLPFYSTKPDGTGLGLALAAEIIEAHGGRLTVQNREGGGVSVSMMLPAGHSLLSEACSARLRLGCLY